MKPVVIENNFFDQTELEDIKTKVFILRDHWKSIEETHDDTEILSNVLPAGSYTFHFSEKEIAANNEIMSKHFSHYYDKIKNKLSSYYNVPIDYSPNLQFPGFHVFVNKLEHNHARYSNIHFHMDNYFQMQHLLKPGKIESIIIPIVLPISGGSLLYNTTTGHNPRLVQASTAQEFHYAQGMMACWPAELVHCIAPFSLLNSDDSRITMQMHVNLQDDGGVIFW